MFSHMLCDVVNYHDWGISCCDVYYHRMWSLAYGFLLFHDDMMILKMLGGSYHVVITMHNGIS